MKKRIIKVASYFGFAIFLYAGMFSGLVAKVSDETPYEQGTLAIIAAILCSLSILFLAYGNSIPWKQARK